MNLISLIKNLYQKIKHQDEIDFIYEVRCPKSGYWCHTHYNKLRRFIHRLDCKYGDKCFYKRI